jgi:molybdopterin biosynthesis enzyme
VVDALKLHRTSRGAETLYPKGNTGQDSSKTHSVSRAGARQKKRSPGNSSMMAPLAKADCLVIREPHAPATKARDRCMIVRLI